MAVFAHPVAARPATPRLARSPPATRRGQWDRNQANAVLREQTTLVVACAMVLTLFITLILGERGTAAACVFPEGDGDDGEPHTRTAAVTTMLWLLLVMFGISVTCGSHMVRHRRALSDPSGRCSCARWMHVLAFYLPWANAALAVGAGTLVTAVRRACSACGSAGSAAECSDMSVFYGALAVLAAAGVALLLPCVCAARHGGARRSRAAAPPLPSGGDGGDKQPKLVRTSASGGSRVNPSPPPPPNAPSGGIAVVVTPAELAAAREPEMELVEI